MVSPEKNINIKGTALPDRLRKFREQRQWSQSDLAEEANLSYRTVHDIESGRRDRVLEKTMMLMAAALDIPYDQLVSETPDPSHDSPHGKWRRIIIGSVCALTALLVLGWAFRHVGLDRGEVQWQGGHLALLDGFIGTERWHRQYQSEIVFCDESPWSPDLLLVGLSGHHADGGRLLALNRHTGEVQWEIRPDHESLERAFGTELVHSANFHCQRVLPLNIDGVGEAEIAVCFGHAMWCPTSLVLVNRDGVQQGHYAHCGQLYDLAVVDLDGDGKDELLAAGSYHSGIHEGGTLVQFDAKHFHGASTDSLTHVGYREPDGARVRLVFPNFPESYMGHLQARRLEASRILTNRDPEGNVTLSLAVGLHDTNRNLVIQLDQELRPHAVSIGDSFLQHIHSHWPDSLTQDTGPGDAAWRADWLAGHHRYESGLPGRHPGMGAGDDEAADGQ